MIELSPAEKIKLLRLGSGMTLQDVSNRTTFSISYLSFIEKGRRPIPDILWDIFDIEDPKEPIWYQRVYQLLIDNHMHLEWMNILNAIKA